MPRFDNPPPVADVAAALLEAPVVLRLGLSVRDERLRERAAQRLASAIVERLSGSEAVDANQLNLAL